MELSEKTTAVLQEMVVYAESNRYEYVTPEMLLLVLCKDVDFREAFSQCDGDVEELSRDLEGYIENYIERCIEQGAADYTTDQQARRSAAQEYEPIFSAGLNFVLSYAGQSVLNSGNVEMKIRHLVYGIWQLEESFAVYYMRSQGITAAELLGALTAVEELEEDREKEEKQGYETDIGYEGTMEHGGNEGYREKSSASWKQYAPCLNEILTDVNPLIGREDELERTIQILCRKDKNNPLHIGEPGVGKTAITYGLVQLIKAGKVPAPLVGSKIFALDLGGMLAGTQYRGDFENRFKKVLGEIGKEEKPILYIDEIHNLSGSGAVGESSFDAANLLKPYLVAGHIRFIGATTFEEYKKYFERNKSLARRFQNVEIKEPSEEETVKILEGLQEKYESFHGVTYEEGVLEYAVSMSAKHINERFLPDKAIDLMDEAGAYRKLHPFGSEEHKTCGGEQEAGRGGQARSSAEHKLHLHGSGEQNAGSGEHKTCSEEHKACVEEQGACSEAHKTCVGEQEAGSVAQTVGKDVISYVLTKICRVPLETVKTDEAEGLATLEERMKDRVFGQDEAITQVVNAIKFSRAGLLEEGKPLASLLFVGPTGVGKTEIARSLAEEMGVKLIRFDMSEYEEKHAVAKLIGAPAGYVGYEEGGLLTEEIRKTPFAVLLLDEIEKAHADIYNILLQVMDYATLTDNQGRKADFRNVVLIMTSNAGANRIGKKGIGFESTAQDAGVLMEEVKRTFQPEFRNRLNQIVVFHGMDDAMAAQVIEKKLGELKVMLEKKDIQLQVEGSAIDLIKEKGVSEEYGAREIDRVIRNEIKPLLVDDILFGKLKKGGEVRLTAREHQFALEV